MTSNPAMLPEAARIHDEVLASGEHLLSQLDMRDVDDVEGDLTIELTLESRLTNPRGALQGGLVATLADIVAGRAAIEGLEPGFGAVTSDLMIRYLAPVDVGPARARATVLRRGRRSIVVAVDIVDGGADGRLAATASVAFTVVRAPEMGPRRST